MRPSKSKKESVATQELKAQEDVMAKMQELEAQRVLAAHRQQLRYVNRRRSKVSYFLEFSAKSKKESVATQELKAQEDVMAKMQELEAQRVLAAHRQQLRYVNRRRSKVSYFLEFSAKLSAKLIQSRIDKKINISLRRNAEPAGPARALHGEADEKKEEEVEGEEEEDRPPPLCFINQSKN